MKLSVNMIEEPVAVVQKIKLLHVCIYEWFTL